MGPLTKDSDDPFTDSDTDEVFEDLLGSSEDLTFGISSEVKILKMADVYSFGLTCSHILGGKLLYPDFSLTKLRKQRMHGFRPELPSSTCPDDLKYLIYSCLEFEPLNRPTFFDICFMLKDLGHLIIPRSKFQLKEGIATTGFPGGLRFYNETVMRWKAKGTNIVHFHMLLDAFGWTSKEVSSGNKERVWERLLDSFSRFVFTLRPHDVVYFWAFKRWTCQFLCRVERKDFLLQLDAIRAMYMEHVHGLALDHEYKEGHLFHALKAVVMEIDIQHEADKELTSFLVPFIDGMDISRTYTVTIRLFVQKLEANVRSGRVHTIFITFNMSPNFELYKRLDQSRHTVSHIRCEKAEPNEISLAFDTLSSLIIDKIVRVPETIQRTGSSEGKKRMTLWERVTDDDRAAARELLRASAEQDTGSSSVVSLQSLFYIFHGSFFLWQSSPFVLKILLLSLMLTPQLVV